MKSRNASAPGWALVGLVIFFTTSAAFGHAIMVESTPKQDETVTAAPKEALLRFNARIEKKLTTVKLVNDNGDKIAMPPMPDESKLPADKLIVPLPELKPGSYQLQFQVMAADGHSTPGVLRFQISGATTAPATQP
jgi:methionine-rich copper-binding protein CopC